MAYRRLDKPNLLFILSDQHRYDAIGSRTPWVQTPHLDQLAADGVRLDHAYCNAQPCIASRACLMTSRYAELNRTFDNLDLLPPPERTWPQALDDAGYQCLAVGRTHHIDRGFETVRVPYGDSYPMITYSDVHEIPWGERGVIETSPVPLEEFYELRVTRTACQLMQDLGRNQPFALYAGFLLPHPPFVLPEPFTSMYNPAEMPWDGSQRPEPELKAEYRRFCPPQFTEARQRRAMAAYYGMVSLLDHCVGRLLEKLADLGLDRETLVVYTSDHGEQLGHRGLWNKGFAYDPSVRVPLLMRWPGHLPESTVSQAMVGNVDVGPTVLDLLNVEAMPHRSGRSFRKVLAGEAAEHRDWIYSSVDPGRMCVYRDHRWKFCDWLREDGKRLVELYDLQADPAEQQNLARSIASDAEPATTIARLRDQLWTFQRSELFERGSALFPDAVQPATFNAQFKP